MGWIQKQVLKRWIKELQQNIDGMRSMSKAYKESGGFKEVGETIEKFKAGELVPYELLAEGRKAELEFADANERLANCYQKLLDHIKKMTEKQ
jgi:prefoldin subunit 5